MKIVFLIAFLSIIKLSGLSQSTEFFRTYYTGINTAPILNNVIELNNNLYLNGTIRKPNQKILLLKTNNTGNLVDTVSLGADTGKYYVGNFLLKNLNKVFLFCIYELSTFVTYEYIASIDTNLLFLDDTLYQQDYTSFWGNVKIGNNYYFGGNTKYDNNYNVLSYGYNFLFWKTDSILNIISSNSIGISNIHEGGSVITAGFDNNLLLGGLTTVNGNQQDWYLVNVDTNGQVLGEYYYGNTTNTDFDGIKSITKDINSNYFLGGVFHYYYMPQIPPGTYSYLSPTVVKIDNQFNTLWTKRFGKPIPGTSLIKMVSTYDNNQAILVQRSPYGLYTTIYSKITKFGNNGDIIWSRNYYQGDTTQYIRYRAWDIIETSNKGFALCGSAIDTFNVGPYQEAWLVKTDSLGCDGFTSCNDTAMVVEILSYPDTLCKNDTNLIHVRIKGRSAPYSLYANGTLAMDSIYYPYTLPLWIDTLMPFVPQDTGWQQLVVTLHEPWERRAYDTVQVYVKNCTTLTANHDYNKNMVDIFPNPATNVLHVNFKTALTLPATITVYDAQGNKIKQITTKKNENIIDISKLVQGVYGIRVSGNGASAADKFVKVE